MNEQIQILIDFHNLRLTPKIIRKPPKMKISRSQERHLKHFLEENSAVHFEADPDLIKYFRDFEEHLNRKSAELSSIPYEIYKENMPLRHTGDEKPMTYNKMVKGTPYDGWFKSEGFVSLLEDHEQVMRIVDQYLESQTIHRRDLDWLNCLGRAFVHGDLAVIGEYSSKSHGDWVDLKQYHIDEEGARERLWHGLPISEIAASIYKAVIGLLNGEVKIKRCSYSKCRRIFTPSRRGSEQLFCSSTCRGENWRQQKG